MSRHVSAEKLARFRDGDLGTAAARRVAAHLAACPACQADADALAGLPALLASAELPPIPDHLAARIETALATESALRAAGSPAPGAALPARPAATGHRRPGRPGAPRWAGLGDQAQRHARRPRPARRILVAAAAVAVVIGGGYALASGLNSSAGPSTSAGSSAAGRSARVPAAAGPAAAPVPRPTVNAPNQPASSGGIRPGATAAPVFGPEQDFRAAGHAGTFTPVRTGTAYAAAELGHQAAATLAQVRTAPTAPAIGAGHSASGQSAGQSTGGAFSAASLTQLRGCVGRIAAGQSVLLVDVASFAGGPATIIVTAPPGSAIATGVWAVGPGCSSSAGDVLDHQRLP